MVKQGMDYDSQGEYIRLWVEELRGIKDGRAHFPWTLSGAELSKSGIELGVTYPNHILLILYNQSNTIHILAIALFRSNLC